MKGDVLYVVGTALQVFAFTSGVRLSVLGASLAAYGAALFIAGWIIET